MASEVKVAKATGGYNNADVRNVIRTVNPRNHKVVTSVQYDNKVKAYIDSVAQYKPTREIPSERPTPSYNKARTEKEYRDGTAKVGRYYDATGNSWDADIWGRSDELVKQLKRMGY